MNTSAKDVLGFTKSMLQFTTRPKNLNVVEKWKGYFLRLEFHSKETGGAAVNNFLA
jgi:hypothetical protein